MELSHVCCLPCRRVLQAMHQAKIEESLAQAKALRTAMANGTLAEMVHSPVISQIVF